MFEAEPGNMFAHLGDLLQCLLQRYTVWEILRLFLGKTIISEFMVYINTSLKRKKVKMVFLLVCYSF